MLSPSVRQVTHALLTRPPLKCHKIWPKSHQRDISVRLACVKHAASVHPEPGSNSRIIVCYFFVRSGSKQAWLFCIRFPKHLLFGLYLSDTLWKIFKNFFSWIFRVALLFICQGAVSCVLCCWTRNVDILSYLPQLVNTFFWNFLQNFLSAFLTLSMPVSAWSILRGRFL